MAVSQEDFDAVERERDCLRYDNGKLRDDYDAACAERANAVASAHDATLRAQRLHEERTALASRVERLEAALLRLTSAVEFMRTMGAYRSGSFAGMGELERAEQEALAALSPQAEKLEKEGV